MSMRSRSALFLLLILFVASWHLDAGHNDNTMSRAAAVASLVDRCTLEITPIQDVTGDKCQVDGRYYSDKAPLPTFVVLPFHWLAVHLGVVTPGNNGTLTDGLLRLGGFICGSIPFALLVTLAWTDLRRRKELLALSPALLAALPFFGSFLFVYSGSFYNHLPEALFAVLAARAVQRERPFTAGLCAGAAFLCGSAMLLLAFAWGLQLLLCGKRRALVPFALGLFPALFLAVLYNIAVTGNPFVFPNAYAVNYGIMHHQYGFGTWQPAAFAGLLFTDYRGLFFYMPFLLLAFFTLPFRTSWKTFLPDPFILPALLLIGAFLTHATWTGGWTYGPRYIMSAAALLAFAVLQRFPNRPWMRGALIGLCTFGVLCTFAAKSTIGYSFPTQMEHPLSQQLWPNIIAGNWTVDQWPVALGLAPAVSSVAFVLTFALVLYLLVRIDRRPTHAPLPLSRS
jgi:hypothetical protein